MTSIAAGVFARARGAWLGQIAGDALGTTVEFKTPRRIAELYPAGLREIVGGGPFSVRPGQVTDDTELALALARSLAEVGAYQPDHVAGAYVGWYDSGPFDIGGTIGAALGGRLRRGAGVAARVARRASRSSQANGSVMRLSPLPIWGWRLAEGDLAALAAFDARLTHANEVCQAANVLFSHAIATAIREGTDARTTYERTLAFAREYAPCAPLVELMEAAAQAAPEDFVKNMGWVRIALQNAFFQLLHAPSLEEGVVDTVMRGGDTDTNACIAGALLGAVHGEAAIPAQWRDAILTCRTGRGPTFQSHDALELAERLVEAGAGAHALPDLAAALVVPMEPEADAEADETWPGPVEDGDEDEEEFDDEGEDLSELDDGTDAPPADEDETRHAGGGWSDAGPLFGG